MSCSESPSCTLRPPIGVLGLSDPDPKPDPIRIQVIWFGPSAIGPVRSGPAKVSRLHYFDRPTPPLRGLRSLNLPCGIRGYFWHFIPMFAFFYVSLLFVQSESAFVVTIEVWRKDSDSMLISAKPSSIPSSCSLVPRSGVRTLRFWIKGNEFAEKFRSFSVHPFILRCDFARVRVSGLRFLCFFMIWWVQERICKEI